MRPTSRRIAYAALSSALLLALAGCSSTTAVHSIGDLHNAAVKNGIHCPSPQTDSSAGLVGGSGEACSDEVELFYFPSNAKRDQYVGIMRKMTALTGISDSSPTLVGDRFAVQAPESSLENVQKALGGKIRE